MFCTENYIYNNFLLTSTKLLNIIEFSKFCIPNIASLSCPSQNHVFPHDWKQYVNTQFVFFFLLVTLTELTYLTITMSNQSKRRKHFNYSGKGTVTLVTLLIYQLTTCTCNYSNPKHFYAIISFLFNYFILDLQFRCSSSFPSVLIHTPDRCVQPSPRTHQHTIAPSCITWSGFNRDVKSKLKCVPH